MTKYFEFQLARLLTENMKAKPDRDRDIIAVEQAFCLRAIAHFKPKRGEKKNA